MLSSCIIRDHSRCGLCSHPMHVISIKDPERQGSQREALFPEMEMEVRGTELPGHFFFVIISATCSTIVKIGGSSNALYCQLGITISQGPSVAKLKFFMTLAHHDRDLNRTACLQSILDLLSHSPQSRLHKPYEFANINLSIPRSSSHMR